MKKFIDTDPRLSEFSDETIEATAVALNMRIADLQKQIAACRKHESLEQMFADEIEKWTATIEHLRQMYAQLVNAGARKTYQKRVASN